MSTTRIQIGPADNGRKMTVDEFREADEERGYSYELARGVLEVTEVPADAHGQVVDNLHEAFSLHRQAHPGLILRIGHASDVRLIAGELSSDRHPDVAIVFRGASLNQRGRQMPGLVIEVVSPGQSARERDYVTKREEYLALGIPEYWIVDPKLRRVTVLVGRFEPPQMSYDERVFAADQIIESPALPGFTGTVAAFWANAELEQGENQ